MLRLRSAHRVSLTDAQRIFLLGPAVPFGVTFVNMIWVIFISIFFSVSKEKEVSKQLMPFLPIADSLTIYVFLHDECVISQYYTPELTRLYKSYDSKKVGFIGYFPNFSSKPEQIEAFADHYKLSFPLKQDYYKDWTRKFGITVTPEVAVWDHRMGQLIYRGRIDDSYVRVGKRKTHPQHHDLEEIIQSWLLNQNSGPMVQTEAIGCFINFTDELSKGQGAKSKE